MKNRRHKKQLTILMLTNTYTPILGGLEKSIQAFSAEFRKRGHRVVVAVPQYEGAPARETHVIRLPAIQHFNGTDFSVNLPVPGILTKLMDRVRPDILHAHHPFLMGDLAVRLSGQYRVPLVYTYHTLFEQQPSFPFPLETEMIKRFVVELAAGYAQLCDHVIAPSQSVRELLRAQGVKRPISVVPTGVDPSFFRRGRPAEIRRACGIPPQAFVVGHIGRLSPEKNLEFLVTAAAQFLQRAPKAHFLIVGGGPLEEPIRKAFAAAGVEDRVHYAGILKGPALINAYQAMDVFVFASQSETQGMVLTEAMASGVPVIAVDAPGVREVVEDGRNGRLLPRQSKNTFCEALNWMARRDARQMKKMKAAARRTAQKFTLGICASRALEVYGRVRRHKPAPLQVGDNPWLSAMGRIKKELGLMANVGKATGAAILEKVAGH